MTAIKLKCKDCKRSDENGMNEWEANNQSDQIGQFLKILGDKIFLQK